LPPLWDTSTLAPPGPLALAVPDASPLGPCSQCASAEATGTFDAEKRVDARGAPDISDSDDDSLETEVTGFFFGMAPKFLGSVLPLSSSSFLPLMSRLESDLRFREPLALEMKEEKTNKNLRPSGRGGRQCTRARGRGR
jgi:hypothetical protein